MKVFVAKGAPDRSRTPYPGETRRKTRMPFSASGPAQLD